MRFAALCLFFLTLTLPVAADVSAMTDQDTVVLRLLDKMTARTSSYDVRVGKTVKFGTLYIKIQSCRKSPPVETPEAASFLQIWEVKPDEKPQWIFSGWMFASSPALSAMDHPVYDVWVIDCKNAATSPASPTPADAAVPPAESKPPVDAAPAAATPKPEEEKSEGE